MQGILIILNWKFRLWKEKKRTIRLAPLFLLIPWMDRVSPYAALLPKFGLTIAETNPGFSILTNLGLDRLQIQDNTNVGSPTPPCKYDKSNACKDSLLDTTVSLKYLPIAYYDTGSITQGSNEDVCGGNPKVEIVTRDEGLDTLGPESPIKKLVSMPLDIGTQSVCHVSQPGIPPLNVLELSNAALAVEDTSSEGSFIPDTDADSEEESLAEGTLDTAWQSSERQYVAPFPTSHSKRTTNFRTRAGHKGSASTSTTTSQSTNNSTSTSSSSNHSRKRMLNSYDDHPADGDDDPPERPRCDISESQNLKGTINLACPFVKHDPEKYNPTDYHTCATKLWHSIDRLK